LEQTGEQVQEILNTATPQTSLEAEVERAQGAEGTLQDNIDAEERARQQADGELQQAISDEETRARAAEQANAGDIDAIEEKIPAQASSSNKLADKDFVNSSIATASATFRGTYNLVTDLHLSVGATRAAIATALAGTIATADNNDYAFVQIPTATATPTEIASIERYKFDGTAWAFEYALNNSGFTAAQWEALNSGITSGLVGKLQALPTNADLNTMLNGKADKSTTYTKTETDNLLATKAPQSTTYTKTEVDGLVGDEETRARAAEQANAGDIDALEALIPSQASAQNKLADKEFVNSSVATATATYRGSFNEVSDLSLTPAASRAEIATALAGTIATADNNDYAFVQIPTDAGTPTEIARVERYKYNGSAWAYEYTLNNSGFTADQWDAINSAITSGLVAKLTALPTNSELTTLLAGKQNTIDDLSTIRSGASAGATAYQKPSGGIPSTDMTSGVQSSLQKADNAAPQSTTYTKTEVDGLIGDEETRARAAEQANAGDIDALEALVPTQASAQNQLADKQFVNSSIGTATATYRGSYNLVSDLSLTLSATHAQVATALASAIATADNNDYCFVQVPADVSTPTVIASVDRYKFDGTAWEFEYTLNNSGFTQAQWDALNSGITSGLVAKLIALPTNSELTTLLAGKQNTINDLSTIRSGASAGATAYQKPSGGIPSTDMTSGVQSSLQKAENAAPQSTTYTKTEVDGLIGDEETRAKAAEEANAGDIDALEALVPTQASAQNQLADKQFVNSSIGTATATYRGSYNLVSDLSLTLSATHAQVATALASAIATADNNDYCFVQVPADASTPTVIASVDRYKFDGTAWEFEYTLNNSGFTQAQWDALNSGITSGLVAKLIALPTNSELTTLFAGKQNTIDDLSTIRSGASAGATAYQKPQTGIPSTDLTAELQAALASFITASTQNLVYYYLKSETYSAAEVDQLIAAVKQFTYVSVQTLPTASASTMNKIYLVPSSDPQAQNVKDEYITLAVTESDVTTYSWECIGSTSVNLSNYYTKSQTDDAISAALTTALASYSTTAQVGTIVSTAVTTALANYYNKGEVYNKTEDDAAALNATRQKSVISGLTAKTDSTGFASTDLIQLYANDGTPNGKISRADLMGVFKALLPGLLSTQSNTTDFLGIDANGLGKTPIATAASLLGVWGVKTLPVTDLNSLNRNGAYSAWSSLTNAPKSDSNVWFIICLKYDGGTDMRFQIAYTIDDNKMYIRGYMNATWKEWREL